MSLGSDSFIKHVSGVIMISYPPPPDFWIRTCPFLHWLILFPANTPLRYYWKFWIIRLRISCMNQNGRSEMFSGLSWNKLLLWWYLPIGRTIRSTYNRTWFNKLNHCHGYPCIYRNEKYIMPSQKYTQLCNFLILNMWVPEMSS